MSYILNIETATKNCSVSLAKEGQTLSCPEIAEQGYAHAEQLHVFIAAVLDQAGIGYNDLAAVAVSKGPGSYTGLRIGVSAAKGLCYALNIPLIAVDTLAVLARQLTTDNGWTVPMIDARRMEVYTAVYNHEGHIIEPVRAEVLTAESFSVHSETLHFVGDSNEKAQTVLMRDNFFFHNAVVYPSARQMGFLSFQKFEKGDFEDVAYFEPYYLKDFMITSKG